ncbi:phospholipase A-2-activating protein [Desarmillaria ectypa]|nr:phospholipase A-2-activating protein [Desarmillaria ectypa]
MPYKLSATLAAHTSDVRGVVAPTNDLVLSASRDSTAIWWQRPSSSSSFAPESVLRAGSRYVNAVAYIPPSVQNSKGYAVTGGQDTVINVFSLDSPKDDPNYTLLGHSENVCALNVSAGGTIISGSWDRTAKVWKSFQLAYDLKGHGQSVWAVLAVDEEQFLTASADKTIKLWQQHKCVFTFTGHRDAVRGLALVPDIGFASCSNDSEIRVWTLGGDVVYSLSGHTSFVYSLSVLPNGDIISGGEDRSVRVWKDGECAQVITHPAISVWAVSSMPNGDIVSGCSDGVVRVFSASEERWASEADLKVYDSAVASQALPSQQVGDVKKSDLPGPEALSTPGDAPGKVKMIRNGDVVEAHEWDATSSTWKKIGDVVDAVGQGRRQLHEGKEYDYVFDVDIQDGVPPLKLPYNASENPYAAAQRFLEKNDLPLSYIDQVVQFIEKNTSGVNLGSGGEDYVDPFTGASRYRSSAASVPASGPPSAYVDPYTGASRYMASSSTPATAQPASSSAYMDPFTGASRYSGVPPQSAPSPPKPSILPVPIPLAFKQANVSAMQSKLFEFNDSLCREISTATLAMYPQEITTVEELFVYLSSVSPTSSGPSLMSASHADAISHILERWPQSQLFPVLDLARLMAGFCPDVFASPDVRNQFLKALLKAGEWDFPWEAPLSRDRQTNVSLVLRTLANTLQENAQIDETWPNGILQALDAVDFPVLDKRNRLPLASLLFNISCLALHAQLPPDQRELHITLALRLLRLEINESEAVYRGLVGLGNALLALNKQGLATSQVNDIPPILASLQNKYLEERVLNIIQEISAL